MLRPAEALDAGFLDTLVAAEILDETVAAIIGQMMAIDHAAHTSTKLRLRADVFSMVEQTARGERELVGDMPMA